MKKIMNITTHVHDLDRFSDTADLRGFYQSFGLDGLEVMQSGEDADGIVNKSDVVGVHLKYFPYWLDLWLGDEKRVLRELDDWKTAEMLFGGKTAAAIVDAYLQNLDFAAKMSPEYMVFHVCDCTMEESIMRRYHYDSKDVIDAAIDLVNRISGSIEGTPHILFENLWYPGLTMLEPELAYRLLDGIKYPYKGVMLDIGHMLHTNMELSTLDESLEYIHSVLDKYGDLSFIKGVHLHQTLSGGYAKRLMQEWAPAKGNYHERYCALMMHVYSIDSHQPFCHSGVRTLIDRIAPEYLVLEQISTSRDEHSEQLRKQLMFI